MSVSIFTTSVPIFTTFAAGESERLRLERLVRFAEYSSHVSPLYNF